MTREEYRARIEFWVDIVILLARIVGLWLGVAKLIEADYLAASAYFLLLIATRPSKSSLVR